MNLINKMSTNLLFDVNENALVFFNALTLFKINSALREWNGIEWKISTQNIFLDANTLLNIASKYTKL